MSEKLTGADHTKLDDQFTQMEKITDVFLEVEVGDNIRSSLCIMTSAVKRSFHRFHNRLYNHGEGPY